MRSKEREDGNNAERDDGRGVNRESFGAEEAPSARTRAAGRKRAVAEAGVRRKKPRRGERRAGREEMKTEKERERASAQQPKRSRGRVKAKRLAGGHANPL